MTFDFDAVTEADQVTNVGQHIAGKATIEIWISHVNEDLTYQSFIFFSCSFVDPCLDI